MGENMKKYVAMACEKGVSLLSDWGACQKWRNKWYFVRLSLSEDNYLELLQQVRKSIDAGVSIALKKGAWQAQAVFSDVDSTLIPMESIDVLAKEQACESKVAAITAATMAGKLSFSQALEERLKYLKGLPARKLEEIALKVEPFPGLREFIGYCQQKSLPFYMVSGGFSPMLQIWAEKWGAAGFRANSLEVEDGLLTGRSKGAVVDGPGKLSYAEDQCRQRGLRMADVLALGDGSNDLALMQQAGLSIGFAPKKVLIPALDGAIHTGNYFFLTDFLELK